MSEPDLVQPVIQNPGHFPSVRTESLLGDMEFGGKGIKGVVGLDECEEVKQMHRLHFMLTGTQDPPEA